MISLYYFYFNFINSIEPNIFKIKVLQHPIDLRLIYIPLLHAPINEHKPHILFLLGEDSLEKAHHLTIFLWVLIVVTLRGRRFNDVIALVTWLVNQGIILIKLVRTFQMFFSFTIP